MKYKQNDGGDAFIDRKGRVWYTTDPNYLPADPLDHEAIPPAFWHPAVKAAWESEQEDWAIPIDRARTK
jgi:hypothetical protein